jgi:hypothetical protein
MSPQTKTLALALLAAACTEPREPEAIQADAETTTLDVETGETTTDPTEPETVAQGWCCDCNNKIGKALTCTPATADSCIGSTLAWCEVDEDGSTSACEAKCDQLGSCCDCSGQPHIECWPTRDDACSYQWCHTGPLACASKCPPVVCCDCTTMSCWPSDGLDCDQPHHRWCVLEPNVDCFATCE